MTDYPLTVVAPSQMLGRYSCVNNVLAPSYFCPSSLTCSIRTVHLTDYMKCFSNKCYFIL